MVSRLLSSIFFLTLVCIGVAQDLGANRESLGKITDSRLNELSGLVNSRKNSSLFWTHNDSGDSARIFLIDRKAKLKCIVALEGVHTVDAEDIAWFERDGRPYLILADIGDNHGQRPTIQLYIFEEPVWQEGRSHMVIPRSAIVQVSLRYDDKPRDAEAFFVDPLDKKGYLISKRDLQVGVYPIDFQQAEDGETLSISRALSLPMTFITAADIAADGSQILLKNIGQVFLWHRLGNASVIDVFRQLPNTVAYQAEPQGEAICFGHENHVFYTVSERPLGLDAYLYSYTLGNTK